MRRIAAVLTVAVFVLPVLAAAPLKILPLGDSRTAGPRSRDCYRLYLDRMLTAAGYAHDFVGTCAGHEWNNAPADSVFDVDHEGRWGWPTHNLLTIVGGVARISQPDIVLALLGTTDILLEGDSAAVKLPRTALESKAVIDTLRAANPLVVILLANLYPVSPNGYNNDQIEAFDSLVPGIVAEMNTAQSPVIFVDTWTGFDRYSMMVDSWHANQQGSALIAQRWFDALRPFYDPATRLRIDPRPAVRHSSASPAGARLTWWSLATGIRDAYDVTGRHRGVPRSSQEPSAQSRDCIVITR